MKLRIVFPLCEELGDQESRIVGLCQITLHTFGIQISLQMQGCRGTWPGPKALTHSNFGWVGQHGHKPLWKKQRQHKEAATHYGRCCKTCRPPTQPDSLRVNDTLNPQITIPSSKATDFTEGTERSESVACRLLPIWFSPAHR